jgi:hypothetical protein
MSSTSGYVGSFLGLPHAGGGVGGQDAYPGVQLNINTSGVVNKVSLINGTQVLATVTVPNDGNNHVVDVLSCVDVTSTETGGAINCVATDAVSSHAQTVVLHAGGTTGPALQAGLATRFVLGPNSTVVINQSSALSAGSAVFSCRVLVS